MYAQFEQVKSLGPLNRVMSMIPGFSPDMMGKGQEREGMCLLCMLRAWCERVRTARACGGLGVYVDRVQACAHWLSCQGRSSALCGRVRVCVSLSLPPFVFVCVCVHACVYVTAPRLANEAYSVALFACTCRTRAHPALHTHYEQHERTRAGRHPRASVALVCLLRGAPSPSSLRQLSLCCSLAATVAGLRGALYFPQPAQVVRCE
jgi:hypothetical protein